MTRRSGREAFLDVDLTGMARATELGAGRARAIGKERLKEQEEQGYIEGETRLRQGIQRGHAQESTGAFRVYESNPGVGNRRNGWGE